MGCSKHLILVISILYVVNAQENAQTRIPSSLLECYEDPRLLQRDSQFPMTMNIFIDLIRKIENTPGLNMEIKNIAIAMLHRFRLDGIIRASSFSSSSNMLPYSPKGFHFYKHRILLTHLIPGNGYSFPNNTLTPLERCTLHRILSNTVEENVRGDEGTVCNQLSQYRTQRLPRQAKDEPDVEIINPETINEMNKRGNFKLSGDVDDNVDFNIIPGSFANGVSDNTGSACPVETGVIKTTWGAISAGTLLAGIAAGLEPLKISVNDISGKTSSDNSLERNKIIIDNKFAATLAGDLAEVSIFQGPKTENNQDTINIGIKGGWNSTLAPKWYFLSQKKDYEFTDAEIRGGMDGLILGTYIQEFKNKASQLKLSQLLEMYYSQRGVFSNKYRACNRQALMTSVTTTDELKSEALGFTYTLDKLIQHSVTIKDSGYVRYSQMATDSLMSFIPSKLNDLSCSTTESHTSHDIQASTNIYIVLDSTWAYHDIYPTLAYLLDNINISPLNSNITLINARTANLIVNSSFYLSEFHENYNASVHSQQVSGFDLPKSLDIIKQLQLEQLDTEKKTNYGGGRSSIALMVINMAVINDADLRFSLDQLKIIYEQIPDMRFLYLVSGSRERFNNLVRDPSKDIFSFTPSNSESMTQVNDVVKRIKEIPRRLVNPRCGNNWSQGDAGSISLPEYVASPMINYYRLHPNYYYKLTYGSVKIQGHGSGSLNVCYSRYIELPRKSNISSENQDITCESVVSNTVEINLANACKDTKYIHKCAPLYVSVEAIPVEQTIPRCIEKLCPFPDSIKYTITLQELGCYSSASRAITQIFVFVLGLFMSMKRFYFI